MKYVLALLMLAPMTASAAPSKLIAISCGSGIGFTVDESFENGTISLVDGSAVGVFPMVAVKKENGETFFQAAIPMIALDAKFSAPVQRDGFAEYEVEVTTQSELDVRKETLFCGTYDF